VKRIADPALLAIAKKTRYEIDANDEYPKNYTGTVIVTLRDGTVREARQPHLRGGKREPLGRTEIMNKFYANAAHGGWSEDKADKLARWCEALFEAPSLDGIGDFRG
jgi:2-methylcitrate dehydratase PrpD